MPKLNQSTTKKYVKKLKQIYSIEFIRRCAFFLLSQNRFLFLFFCLAKKPENKNLMKFKIVKLKLMKFCFKKTIIDFIVIND